MDFTGQFHQFAGGQPGPYQQHQFIPVPLTPSHSQSNPSDDYNNSPPEAFDSLPANDRQFHSFDYAQQGFQQPQNPGFSSAPPGPPTPPGQSAFTQQQPASLASGTNGSAFTGVNHLSGADVIGQPKSESDDLSNGRGWSEEDNLTPAQSKRKAQNRAAQRAFRERKEKHVKDLETKLTALEAAQQHASAENERLNRDLQKMTTENEILKATGVSNASGNSGGGGGGPSSHSPEPMTTGPMHYSPTDFASSVLQGHNEKAFSHRIVKSADGQPLLAAGASWDLIISHELFKQGLVDIGAVSEHLRKRAVCDGQGPVFSEKDVLEAIELSVASGSDDLL